jgi:RimJ/RimL family protein N-acetyltransferase
VKVLPEQIETSRLIMRVPGPDDAAKLNQAIVMSQQELQDWLPWAGKPQTLEETREFCGNAEKRRVNGEGLDVLLELKSSGETIGGAGFPRLNWDVPKFEIGYWCRTDHTGRGLVSEATFELARFAFDKLAAARVELFIDARNTRSYHVAERLGFNLEGLHRADARDPHGNLCDMLVYAATSLASLDRPRG